MWEIVWLQSFCFNNILEQNLTCMSLRCLLSYSPKSSSLSLKFLVVIDFVRVLVCLGKTMGFERQKQSLILWWMVSPGPRPAVFLFPFCGTLPWESLLFFKIIPETRRTPVISLTLPRIAAGLWFYFIHFASFLAPLFLCILTSWTLFLVFLYFLI